MIKVLLVDDHTLVRKGIRMLLQDYPDVEIIGESHDGNDAILKTNQLSPDVVLMDLSMPDGLDGFAAIREILKDHREVKVIVLTMYDEEIYIQEALQIGVHGYILKNSHGEVLIEAIRAVYRGKRYYKTSISEEKLDQWMSQEQKTGLSLISFREKEIVRLFVLGFTNKEIADKLMISVKTVENHKSNIMQKLKLSSKHELIQFAIKNKYFDLAL